MSLNNPMMAELVEDLQRRSRSRCARSWLRAAPGADAEGLAGALASALQQRGRAVIHLRLPSYHLDAVEHVLGQLCQALGPERIPPRAYDAARPLHQRVREITGSIGHGPDAPCLVLGIPRSWLVQPRDPRRTLPDNPRAVLSALLEADLDAIVASIQRPAWLSRLLAQEPEELPPEEAGKGYLLDPGRWMELLPHAERLAWALGDAADRAAPVALRLGVACAALGWPVARLGLLLQKPQPIADLVITLRESLRGDAPSASALLRLTMPRFPVPQRLLEEVVGPMPDAARAVALCLTDVHEGQAKAHPVIDDVAGRARRTGEPAARRRLVEHYRAEGGAPTAEPAVRAGNIISWLEHHHHKARLGPTSIEQRSSFQPLSRMWRYELAWSLSAEFREYELAASLYEELAAESPRDAYSHHYRAWNLDQAGKSVAIAWREYEKALEIEPDNPWYNSRYITFLRDNGLQDEARAAWRKALRHVLPSRRWGAWPNLPAHLHRWVARSALDAGDIELAEEVLDPLTAVDLDRHLSLRALRREAEHLKEIDDLGDQIYPVNIPVASRWKQMLYLSEVLLIGGKRSKTQPKQARLTAWYPGRVLSAERGIVALLLADPRSEPRELFVVKLKDTVAAEMAGGEPARPGRFLEYGTYEGGIGRIRYYPRPESVASQERFAHGLRYLHDESAVRR